MTSENKAMVRLSGFNADSMPTRDKFQIELTTLKDDELDVKLLVPISFDKPEELEPLKGVLSPGQETLQLRYTVNSNLKAEKDAFLDEIEKMYRTKLGKKLRGDELTVLTDAEIRELLGPLVSQGRSVFHGLFLSSTIEYRGVSDEDTSAVKQAVRSALSRPHVLTINSSAPLFPWAFLFDDPSYDSTKLNTIKPTSFWGFRHEIQDEFSNTPQRILLPAHPQLVTSVDTGVDTGSWHSAADHPFATMKPRFAPSINDLGKELGNFGGDLFYFFGHAAHKNPPTPATSWVQLSGINLTVSDLEINFNAPKFKSNPVVAFLNGCNTAPLIEWNANTIVGYLCFRGKNRLCCVASVGELPAAFAAEFAKIFWQGFVIDHLAIGTAILSARRKMLEKWNNPLGLLYMLFGRVDTYIETEVKPVETAGGANG